MDGSSPRLRRRGRRVAVSVGARITQGVSSETVFTRAVSTSGAFLSTSSAWRDGPISVVFYPPGEPPIARLTRFVHQYEEGIAVEFVDGDGDADAAARLSEWLEGAAPGSTRPVKHSVLVRWQVGRRTAVGEVLDLSLDGIALLASDPPSGGEEVLIRLRSEAGDVVAKSRVVRKWAGCFAVRFQSPGALFRCAIRDLREQLATPQHHATNREIPLKVLVVPGDSESGDAYRKALQGHELVLAQDYEDALALLAATERFDLVVSDYTLGQERVGADLLIQAQQRFPHAIRVLMVEDGFEGSIPRQLDAGVAHVVEARRSVSILAQL